jgi:hypothetical protein
VEIQLSSLITQKGEVPMFAFGYAMQGSEWQGTGEVSSIIGLVIWLSFFVTYPCVLWCIGRIYKITKERT